jgi:protease-4
MKKGLIIALIIILVVGGLGILFFLSVQALTEQDPSLKAKTVLVLDLTGELPESAPNDFMTRLFEPPVMTWRNVINDIEKAGTDTRITGIWLKIDNPNLGWAKVQELQEKLVRFKKTGKFVIASMDASNERDYACALPADKIYLPPEGMFEFNGFVARAYFYKDMFNKFGIDPEVENIGKYKSFGDMLKRSTMSDAQREVMNDMLDKTVADFTAMIQQYRGIPPETSLALMEEGVSHPEEALGHKLIDGVLYADEVENIVKEKNGEKGQKRLTSISGKKYRKVSWDALGQAQGEQIAVIYAVGTIVRGPDVYSPIFGRSMGSDPLVESVRKARDNKAVKAIILRIDSPGGDGLASDLMWRELRLADKEKPVIASMSDVAASGGYYIAMGCRRIVAEPDTITGSIGVVSAKFNLKGMYDWMQLRVESIQRGKWADMMDESRSMTPEEWDRFRQQTRRFYDHFVTKAAESRGVKYDALEPFAQGRVWLGAEAKEHGLVDELGSLDKAVDIARKEAGIAAGKKIRLVEYPEPKKLFDQIMESLSDTGTRQQLPVLTPEMQRSLQPALTPEMQRSLRFLGRFALPGTSATLAVLPYDLVIE